MRAQAERSAFASRSAARYARYGEPDRAHPGPADARLWRRYPPSRAKGPALREVALTALGLTIIVAFLIDVFVTILSTSRAGPLTRAWSQPLWRALLALHNRRRIHHVLEMTGPALVVTTILLWYAGLVLGTWLVFVGHPGAVVSGSTNLPASASQTLYFIPTTLSGLGYGDYVPNGFPWTLFATTMSLLGTMVLTVSLSYVISVLSATITTRTMASGIGALGADAVQIASRARLGDPTSSMQVYLSNCAAAISDVAERQRAYPVLRYFHSARPQTSAAPAVLMLADASFLLSVTDPADRPGPGLAAVLDAAISDFAAAKKTPERQNPDSEHRRVLEQQAACLGIDTRTGSDYRMGLSDYLDQRQALVAACSDDGWPREETGAA